MKRRETQSREMSVAMKPMAEFKSFTQNQEKKNSASFTLASLELSNVGLNKKKVLIYFIFLSSMNDESRSPGPSLRSGTVMNAARVKKKKKRGNGLKSPQIIVCNMLILYSI